MPNVSLGSRIVNTGCVISFSSKACYERWHSLVSVYGAAYEFVCIPYIQLMPPWFDTRQIRVLN